MGPALTPPELAALSRTRLQVVYADEDSLAAMGSNPLDPRSRGPAAEAGRRVGRRAAESVAALWE
jgi:NTE family protein